MIIRLVTVFSLTNEAVVGAKLHHPKGSETASLNADVQGKNFYLSRYELNELVFRRLEIRVFHLELLVTSHATTRNQLNASAASLP